MAVAELLVRLKSLLQVIAALPVDQLVVLYHSRNRKGENDAPEPTVLTMASRSSYAPTPSKTDDLSRFRSFSLPTTEETINHLKRKLAKELYRFELDLVGGCKIAGKACDCCEKHPMLGIEAMCEELIPMDPHNPAYREIPKWIELHQVKLTTEASASGKYDDEYPVLASDIRDFRKRVMGTESIGAMLTAEEKGRVKKRASELVEASMEG